MAKPTIIIRKAEAKDCEAIVGLIRELAIFEKMEDQVHITPQDLVRDGFESNPPLFSCLVAELETVIKSSDVGVTNCDGNIPLNGIVGYAIYFPKYSTWEGKGLHLEDLYITPAYRQHGIGRRMIHYLAKFAVDGDYCRLNLECLNWNEAAIQFYKTFNAINLTESEGWNCFRFTRSILSKIVESAGSENSF